MIKKIQNDSLDIFGASFLLLASFYFYRFSVFAVPNLTFILIELFKILLLLLLVNIVFVLTQGNKFRNFFLFIFLIYISIFFLKLLFDISGDISLHFFLKKIYSFIFNFKIDGTIPIYVKVLSYCTPFLFIISILFIFRNRLIKVKRFFVIFGFFVSLIVIWDLIKIYDKQKILYNSDIKNSQVLNENKKKVLWLLFDGLDPEYMNYTIEGEKLFTNLNELKDKSVYHNNMVPPSNWTIYSMPSQLMGVNVKDMVTKHNSLIFKTLDDKNIPFNFENSIFNKVHNLGYDVSLISSVLEYCTAYLISIKWKNCEDLNNQNISGDVFMESLKYYFSILFKFRNYLNQFDILKSNSTNVLLNIPLKENLPKINFEDLDHKNLHFDKNYSVDHTNLINVDKILKNLKETSFMYLHMYTPHLIGNSINLIKNNFNLNIQNGDEYILKYLYIDLLINRLLLEIKENNLNDLLLIISSDHWNRSKDINHKKNSDGKYIGNSYFSAKFLNDDNNYILEDASNSIVINGLIENYYSNNIINNKDIYDFINSNNEKVYILMKH